MMAGLSREKWQFNKVETGGSINEAVDDITSTNAEVVYQGQIGEIQAVVEHLLTPGRAPRGPGIVAFRKFVCPEGDDEGRGVLLYLQSAPDCAELLSALDHANSSNVHKNCISLMYTLSDILKTRQRTAGISTVASQIDAVAKAVLQRIKVISAHLASGNRGRVHSSITLLMSVAQRSKALARELVSAFDFSLSALPKLANPPRVQEGSKPGRLKPTRTLLIEFVLCLLVSGDAALVRNVLSQRPLMGGVMQHLGSDPPALVSQVLGVLRQRVLAESAAVPPRLQALLFGDGALEQLAAVSALTPPPAVVADGGEGEDKAAAAEGAGAVEDAAAAAHEVLIALCTRPAHGVFPGEGAAAAAEAGEDGKGGAARIARLMHKLRATEVRRHLDLVVAIADASPALASSYLASFPSSVEPRPSARWLAAMSLVGRLAERALDVPPFAARARAGGEPPPLDGAAAQAFARRLVPPCLPKNVLSRGVQHSSLLVRYVAVTTLLRVVRCAERALDEVAAAEAAAREWAGDGGGGGGGREGLAEQWGDLGRRVADQLRVRVPDPQTLVALYHALEKDGGKAKAGDTAMGGAEKSDEEEEGEEEGGDESEMRALLSTRLLALLASYQRHLPASLADCRFDPHRLLTPATLAAPPLQQLGVLRLLRAHHDAAGGAGAGGVGVQLLSLVLRLAMGSPHGAVADEARGLASCLMGEASLFGALPLEVGAWLGALPPSSSASAAAGTTAAALATFLAEAVSGAARRAPRIREQIHAVLRLGELLPPEGGGGGLAFGPLAAAGLGSALRVVRSTKMGAGERAAVAGYAAAALGSLLQLQPDPSPLALLLGRLLAGGEAAGGAEGVPDSPGPEWWPLLDLHALCRDAASPRGGGGGGTGGGDGKRRRKGDAASGGEEGAVGGVLPALDVAVGGAAGQKGAQGGEARLAAAVKALAKAAAGRGGSEGAAEVAGAELGAALLVAAPSDIAAHLPAAAAAAGAAGEEGAAALLWALRARSHATAACGGLLGVPGLVGELGADEEGEEEGALARVARMAPLSAVLADAAGGSPHLLGRGAVVRLLAGAAARCPDEPAAAAACRVVLFWSARLVASAGSAKAGQKSLSSKKRGRADGGGGSDAEAAAVGALFAVLEALLMPRAGEGARTLAARLNGALGHPLLAQGYLRAGGGGSPAMQASLDLHCTLLVRRLLRVATGEGAAGGAAGPAESSALRAACRPFEARAAARLEAAVASGGHARGAGGGGVDIDPGVAHACAALAPVMDPGVRATALQAALRAGGGGVEGAGAEAVLTGEGGSGGELAALLLAAAVIDGPAGEGSGLLSRLFRGMARLIERPSEGRGTATALSCALRVVSGGGARGGGALHTRPEYAALAGSGLLDACLAPALSGAAAPGDYDPAGAAVALAAELVRAVPLARMRLAAQLSAAVAAAGGGALPPATLAALVPAALAHLREEEAGTPGAAAVASAFRGLALAYVTGHGTQLLGPSSGLGAEGLAAAGRELDAHGAELLVLCLRSAPLDAARAGKLAERLCPEKGWWGGGAKGAAGAGGGAVVAGPRVRARAAAGVLLPSPGGLAPVLRSVLASLRVVLKAGGGARPGEDEDFLLGQAEGLVSRLGPGHAAGGRGPDELLPSLRAFSTAALKARFRSPRVLRVLRVALASLHQSAAAAAPAPGGKEAEDSDDDDADDDDDGMGGAGGGADGAWGGEVSPGLAALGEELFERVVGHSGLVGAMVDPAAASPALPGAIQRLPTPLTSILPLVDGGEEVGADGGGGGGASAGGPSLAGAGAEAAEGAGAEAEALRMELARLLSAALALRDGGGGVGAGGGVWRADVEGALLPLLLAAYGATLSGADRAVLHLVLSIEARRATAEEEGAEGADAGGVASLGYLWGAAAGRAHREGRVSGEEHAQLLREESPVDPRRAALAALHLPARRSLPPEPPAAGEGARDPPGPPGPPLPGGPAVAAAAYDPAWLLPFAVHSLHSGAMGLLQAAQAGLLSLAFAALASADDGMRAAAYAVLARAAELLPESSFPEKPQVAMLLAAVRGAVSEDLQRVPHVAASLAAEAVPVLLNPGGELSPAVNNLLLKSAGDAGGLDLTDVPLFYTLFGSGSSQHRVERVWMLRLLAASLASSHAARLFRRRFVLELLMSFHDSSLADAATRLHVLRVLRRAAALAGCARDLSDNAGLPMWLAGAAVQAMAPDRAAGPAAPRYQLAMAAVEALGSLLSHRVVQRRAVGEASAEFAAAVQLLTRAVVASPPPPSKGGGASSPAVGGKGAKGGRAASLQLCRAVLRVARVFLGAAARRQHLPCGAVLPCPALLALARALCPLSAGRGGGGGGGGEGGELEAEVLEVVLLSPGGGLLARPPAGGGSAEGARDFVELAVWAGHAADRLDARAEAAAGQGPGGGAGGMRGRAVEWISLGVVHGGVHLERAGPSGARAASAALGGLLLQLRARLPPGGPRRAAGPACLAALLGLLRPFRPPQGSGQGGEGWDLPASGEAWPERDVWTGPFLEGSLPRLLAHAPPPALRPGSPPVGGAQGEVIEAALLLVRELWAGVPPRQYLAALGGWARGEGGAGMGLKSLAADELRELGALAA